MTRVTPVLLAGGSGTRLWPLSRKSYPKQFVSLLGEETPFQAAARRLTTRAVDPGSALEFRPPVAVTNSDFRFIVAEQLHDAGIDPAAILIEPEGRNTAPAILAAALHLLAQDPDAIMLVAPSDHAIPDTKAFHDTVALGLEAVAEGRLVTFGVRPTHPETAYGYLEVPAMPNGSGRPMPLRRFVEKPRAEQAALMLAEGNYLWNAGIFLFAAKDIRSAFLAHAPDLCGPVEASVRDARPDLGFLRLDPAAWARARDISIDYAVMEKADNLSVVLYDSAWSDLGGWDAIWRNSPADENGVVLSGGATAIDCHDTLLRSDSPRLEVVGIGLQNIMAVAMNDAVLVADMGRAQEVKSAVEVLRAKGVPQATQFPKDHRPWGWFESLVVGPRFQVKRIHVNPGGSLSLQSHLHRSEHWIVVEGTARVTVGDTVKLVAENESIYVPLGAVHRMENPGRVPMVLIEVQTGTYVGEDDIIRYQDVYARS
ncbi:mannose-1-phosphate guanylyltransferase/mannose-6-phosphate isomerase [Rubellimicrobium arenae]|uniref:mannose-1-phosphate guanylyltransferase/mannose-6-phosphate isomerase n=1 Tax=Rubellimicrobium arenae TaxID=2817372 RepID=UPI001B3002BD|nr:mannose-1-phosphate guanylyltransferase/mannose-6-phosphate isomerase [Rubellimicrobium arenae]